MKDFTDYSSSDNKIDSQVQGPGKLSEFVA